MVPVTNVVVVATHSILGLRQLVQVVELDSYCLQLKDLDCTIGVGAILHWHLRKKTREVEGVYSRKITHYRTIPVIPHRKRKKANGCRHERRRAVICAIHESLNKIH